MPITPLHFGVLAPINHFAKSKVSNVSFILVNLILDFDSIMFVLTGDGSIKHGPEHSFMGALFFSTLVGMFGVRSWKWVIGAYLGGFTHIALDMLVHPEMVPLDPWMTGNPFYMGWMEPLSLVLLPFTVWLTAQYVSGIRGLIQKYLAAWRQRTV